MCEKRKFQRIPLIREKRLPVFLLNFHVSRTPELCEISELGAAILFPFRHSWEIDGAKKIVGLIYSVENRQKLYLFGEIKSSVTYFHRDEQFLRLGIEFPLHFKPNWRLMRCLR